jgi:DNA-binding transcriptional LysR family regulator
MAKAVDWESRIGRRLRLRDLHIFFAVAETGSMAKTGAILRVTQPAVSRAIADLEAAVGVRLLDRSPRGVEPTVYGRALLECGSAVFDELRQGIRKIEHLADPTAGELRIGCQTTLAGTVLPPIIEQLSDKYPRLNFEVTDLISPTLEFPALRQRKIDLVLTHLPGPLTGNKLGDELTSEIVFEDRLYIAAGVHSRWARRRKVEITELTDEHWLVPPAGSWSWSFVAEAFAAKGRGMPNVKVATYSVPLLRSLPSSGKLITVEGGLTLHFVGKQMGIQALPIDLPRWPWPVAIVMLRNRTISPAVNLFIEHARSFFAQLRRQLNRKPG